MGKVREGFIKRWARKIVEEFPDLKPDFDYVKEFLKDRFEFPSKRVRNRVAGYVVRLLKRAS